MTLLMKHMALLVGMVVAFEGSALALPCSNGTLAAYIGLGSTGCTIGDALFSDFAALNVPTGVTPILPGDITVNPLSTPFRPGFEFQLNLTAGSGEPLEALISYVGSASFFIGNTLSIEGSSATGDGIVAVIEDKCLGGKFGPGCPGDSRTLIVFDTVSDAEKTAQLSFLPVNLIGVVTDIAVDGGLDGTGTLGSTTNQFQITSVTEPSTIAMALLGAFTIGFFYPRRRRA